MTALRKREDLHRRTYQRVRRDSRPAGGGWEEGFRCRLSRKELLQLKIAAEKFDVRSRQRGRRNGLAGGYVALRVLGLFANLAIKHQGWVAIGAVEIARLVGCSYSAVRRALGALRGAKVIRWARRWREAEDRPASAGGNPRGASVEQDTNLYLVDFPPEVRRALGISVPSAPDDELARRAERDRQRRDMSAEESGLGAALRRLSRAVLGPGDWLDSAGPPLRDNESSWGAESGTV